MTHIHWISTKPETCSGCLCCALACSFFTSTERAFNPSQSKIRIVPDPDDGRFEIEFTEDCTLCGICADYCEFGVLSQE